MLFSKETFKNSLKGLKLAGVVGMSALIISQTFIHNELFASTLVPATYDVTSLYSAINRSIPDGYVKGTYKIDYTNTDTPRPNDLSLEEAAEIIAQEIFRLSKQDLSGETLHIYYKPAADGLNSIWGGSIDDNPNYSALALINSSTGELYSVSYEKYNSADGKVDDTDEAACKSLLSAIKAFKANETANCDKAKKVIAASGYIPEAITAVKYYDSCVSTRYINNKALPSSVSYIFKVTSESGNVYHFTLNEDLTQIVDLYTPSYLLELDARQSAATMK